MQNKVYNQVAKRKAVERWENEGGRVCRDEASGRRIPKPDERNAQTNAGLEFEDQRTTGAPTLT